MQLLTLIKKATLTASGDHQSKPNLDTIQISTDGSPVLMTHFSSCVKELSHSSYVDGPGTIVVVDSGKIIQIEHLEVCSVTDFPRNGNIYKTRTLAIPWTKEVSWSHK